ncbi:MAG: hypothetical protein ABIB55_00110 [Candidatus Nealsonbacteria bacterium]
MEKLHNNDSRFYLVLIFLSAVLASVSKLSGLFLFFPLGWLLIKNFKNQQFRKTYFYLLLTAFPLLLWLLRNYLIYDSPFFPLLNEIFKGRYYSIVLAANQIAQGFNPPFWANILARITEVSVSLVLLFCPLIILSFYSFWKKRKIEYILLFFISFLTVLLFIANQEYIRYIMPFLAVFIVYAVVGLAEIKSRIFLSMIFFLNLWGLFATKISLSQSQFFAPVEGMLNDFLAVSQFVYDYKLILALAFSVFFFFLISPYRQSAKYLILMVVFTYLVKTQVFHLGTWLNIWLPILGLIFIILAWRSVIKLKEEKLLKLIVAYLAVLLIFNSWGLCTAYFLAHRNFVFPNVAEEYGAQPEAAAEIEKLEQGNRDFYIYAASPSYFTWYHNFKTVASRALTFHVITNLEYQENLNSSEVYDLFKRSRIKYVVDNHYWPQLEPFFDKIKSRSDLFEPIFQKKGVYLWQVK